MNNVILVDANLPELSNRGRLVVLNARLRNMEIARILLEDEEYFDNWNKTSKPSTA